MNETSNWKSREYEFENLVKFFLISFGWTWLYWSMFIFQLVTLPEGMGTPNVNLREALLFIPIVVFSPYGPTFAAFILTYLNEGREATRNLWRRTWDTNIPRKWLITTILFQPAVLLFYRIISAIGGVSQPQPQWLSNPLMVLIPFIASMINGGLSEEIGWRGYALPRLQARYSAFWSSVILGFLEGLWHVPLIFWVGDARYGMSIPLLILWQMMATFYRSWIFNNTGGSIFAAVLFHAIGNTAGYVVPINLYVISWLPRTKYVSPFLLIVNVVLIVILLAVYGTEEMIYKKQLKPIARELIIP